LSEYSYVMDLIQDNNFELKEKEKNNHQPESFNNDEYQDLSNNEPTVFDLQKFGQELYEKSYLKNKNYFEYASNINAYDVTSGCIRSTIFKLLKVPTKSYADKWLPLAMRSTIGNAIHDFIQLNSKQFTEKEVVLKVPSLHFSGRADGLINNNVFTQAIGGVSAVSSRSLRKAKDKAQDIAFWRASFKLKVRTGRSEKHHLIVKYLIVK